MRILFTIPHYARPGGHGDPGTRHGSLAGDSESRIRAISECVTALHQLFNSTPCFIHHGKRAAIVAQSSPPSSINVVICTTGDCHLLDRLPIEPRYYTHRATSAEPLLLGFECHAVLREALGRYDFYCYVEDDLIVRDPWFFRKLEWFNRFAGADKLLQPSRFEAGLNHAISKVYIDGDLEPHVTAPFQNPQDGTILTAEHLGVRLEFQRTLNPHAGCFFLSAEQMAYWVRQRHFRDHASRFIGPLETAATLGIMRTFQVYRPIPRYSDFLEIQHAGTGYLEQIRSAPGGGAS